MADLHGGDIYSRPVRLDYSVNINPLGMPPKVLEAAAASLAQCQTYPDAGCRRLKEALAQVHQVEPEQVVCGNGAADLIFALALAERPRKAMVTAPAFSEYRQALEAAGSQVREFPLKEEEGFELRPSELIQALKREKPDLVFLCNPNNPTGKAVSGSSMEEIARACQDLKIQLAVDECFCGFLEQPEAYSLIPRLGRLPEVFVLRAFTKTCAMAGLRLGYGISRNQALLAALERCRQPWSVSWVAQAAGLAALKEEAWIAKARDLIQVQRPWLAGELRRLGMKVYDSQANYLLFSNPREQGEEKGRLFDQMLKKGILIRGCGNYQGLDASFYRICVREEASNRQLIQALEEVQKEESYGERDYDTRHHV